MRIDILTVVPELLASPLNESILKRAQEKGLVEIHIHNIRDYTEDKHRTTDATFLPSHSGSEQRKSMHREHPAYTLR